MFTKLNGYERGTCSNFFLNLSSHHITALIEWVRRGGVKACGFPVFTVDSAEGLALNPKLF